MTKCPICGAVAVLLADIHCRNKRCQNYRGGEVETGSEEIKRYAEKHRRIARRSRK